MYIVHHAAMLSLCVLRINLFRRQKLTYLLFRMKSTSKTCVICTKCENHTYLGLLGKQKNPSKSIFHKQYVIVNHYFGFDPFPNQISRAPERFQHFHHNIQNGCSVLHFMSRYLFLISNLGHRQTLRNSMHQTLDIAHLFENYLIHILQDEVH